MLQRSILSNQPIFALVLYLILVPSLYFLFHALGDIPWWQHVLSLLATGFLVFFTARVLEQSGLVKNSFIASGFALILVLLISPIGGLHVKSMLFCAAVLVNLVQGVKLYKTEKSGSYYLGYGFMVGVQFLLFPLIGLLSFLGFMPFILFGAGFGLKDFLSYLMGLGLSIYLYFSLGYLFGFSTVLSIERLPSQVRVAFLDLPFIGLMVLSIFAFFLLLLSSSRADHTVEKRFYHGFYVYSAIVLWIQGLLLSFFNDLKFTHLLATVAICMIFSLAFGQNIKGWVSVFFLIAGIALAVFRALL